MSVLTFPGRDFTTDMQAVADAARRNTHMIVATHRTGDKLSLHARPRREARECRNELRQTLSSQWTVKTVRVRRWWR